MGAREQGAELSTGRWSVIPRTLVLIRNGDDVLLMKRSAHTRVFPGRYNGVGGHLERGEDPQTGALREIQEETGLTPTQIHDLAFRGAIHIDAGTPIGILLFLFTARSDSREVGETEEGTLQWVPLATTHELPLVEDLPILLPRLFAPDSPGVPFFAHVHYDANDRMVMTFA